MLKPGGRLVLLDSLQRGDEPAYDGLLERFPQNYHEPYYRSYVDQDLSAIAQQCGLTLRRNVKVFVSKVDGLRQIRDPAFLTLPPDKNADFVVQACARVLLPLAPHRNNHLLNIRATLT